MLIEKIQEQIAKYSYLTFSEYMELVLFDKSGVYEKDAVFNENGHFVTSPHISKQFSNTLAKHFAKCSEDNGLVSVLDCGGGDATLACDFLLYLKSINKLPQNYYFLEKSKKLKEYQQKIIKENNLDSCSSFTWIETCELAPKSAFIIANEFFDCLPTDIFRYFNNNYYKAVINKDFKIEWLKPKTDDLNYINKLNLPSDLPNNYCFEFSKSQKSFIDLLSSNVEQAEIIIIDYGYSSKEMYLKDRNEGTITCIGNHISDFNPLEDIGDKDISSFVNFSFLNQILLDNNWQCNSFLSQAHYLLSFEILENINYNSPSEINSIKKLIMPNQMGEIFKVLIASKNIENQNIYNLIKNDIRKL